MLHITHLLSSLLESGSTLDIIFKANSFDFLSKCTHFISFALAKYANWSVVKGLSRMTKNLKI